MLFHRFEAVPAWQALAASFGAGMLVAGLLASYQVLKARMLTYRYRKTARGLEAEVHQLRSLPLSSPEATGEGDASLEAPGGRALGGRA